MINRPDPDKILKQIQAEESSRGKLKIFFGAVAGVGKTYSMLEEAKRRKKEGVDVLVGVVETHKRSETEALLEGLKVLPQKTSLYKNIEIKEFDLEEALKIHPGLILVDELAHTNAPGSVHAKRWQDVDELLEAGIDVYTTLNVQHCESMNDLVAQITRVIVHEMVPDSFLEKADEIELVDIPPEELLKRLKEGKVYLGEQAEIAAQNFFRLGNLIALRQLALKYTTRSVDNKLREYKDIHTISTVWKVGEHFLVCISSNPRATKIIRAAKQIAVDLGAQWTVAYVEAFSSIESAADKENINEMLRFAEKIGAQTTTLSGESVEEAIISYCRSKNISKIIMGKPGKPKFGELFLGSFIDKLARKCGEIDLYLISGEIEEALPKHQHAPMDELSWKAVFFTIGVVGACTVINKFLFSYLALANLIMVFLLGITWLAFCYGRRVAIIGTLLSIASFDFFFIPPFYTFSVMRHEHIITFGVMLIVGVVIGGLTGRLRRQTLAMSFREQRNQVLYSLSRDLAKSSRPEELFQMLLAHIQDFFKYPAVIFAAGADKKFGILTAVANGRELAAREQEIASWSYQHRKTAGKGTETLSGSAGFYIPLVASQEVVGVLGIFPGDSKDFLSPDNYHVLEMFVKQTASAVEGAWLAAANIKAENELERTRLRNMILDTSAYDVKGSLQSISQAAAQLVDQNIINNADKRNDLIKKIQVQAKQLDELVGELPKIMDDLKQL